MKVITLTAENFKRITAVQIAPDGSVVSIGGKNEAGKTSVLDAIQAALGGADYIPLEPVRRGASKGKVRLDLGDLVVTRTFTASGGGVLVVAAKDGAVYPSPQAVLDKLVGDLAFDPLEFERQKPKDQGETLRRLVGLDLSDIDRQRGDLYEERTNVNRDVKSAQARAADMPTLQDVPEEPLSVDDLLRQLADAKESGASVRRAGQAVKAAEKALKQAGQTVDELTESLRKAQQAKAQAEESLLEAQASESVAASDVIPVEPIEAQVRTLTETNTRIRQNADARAAQDEVRKLKVKSDGLSASILALDAERASRIAAATFPVPGLGLSDVGVTYDGLPFEQASAAVKLRVSVAIGLAANSKLRIMLIRDGSLLDQNSLRILAEMTQAADAQLWIEMVQESESGPASIYIEDGAVKSKPIPLSPPISVSPFLRDGLENPNPLRSVSLSSSKHGV